MQANQATLIERWWHFLKRIVPTKLHGKKLLKDANHLSSLAFARIKILECYLSKIIAYSFT